MILIALTYHRSSRVVPSGASEYLARCAGVKTLSFGIYSQDTPLEIWIDDLRFVEKH